LAHAPAVVDIRTLRHDDDLMRRALLLPALLLAIVPAAAVQTRSMLHITVTVVDAGGRATPVPRHVLLISDNPATAPPRRVVTALDGTADVALSPGNYTIESDRPFTLQGKSYQWTQTVDVVAGRDGALELTPGNADAETSTGASGLVDADASAILAQWQKSVLALWTPTTHASGFVIDAAGLIATNARVVGTASSVEVDIAPSVKVPARVLAADAARDIAVLWVDPNLIAALPPVPLGCTQPAAPIEGQPLFTIATPLHGPKRIESGTVSRIEPHALIADFTLATGGAGGPAFSSAGAAIGVTTAGDQGDERDPIARIVRLDYTCAVIAEARTKMKGARPPDGTHLPIEPDRGVPVDALKEMVKRRAGSLNPYTITSTDFDVAFITPVMIYASQYQSEQAKARERRSAMRTPQEAEGFVRPLLDFRNWSGYVDELPPVLLVRVTPRLVEGFWTTVARGAARTQGVSLPPIKHFKSGFSRLRAFCGSAEVTPIHRFKLEQRISEDDAIYEGLYVFNPAAFGPHCATAKLVLYSDKEPDKGDSRTIDARVLEQIWQDFAPYRH
jgi:S1-C subfamily serine protease